MTHESKTQHFYCTPESGCAYAAATLWLSEEQIGILGSGETIVGVDPPSKPKTCHISKEPCAASCSVTIYWSTTQ